MVHILGAGQKAFNTDCLTEFVDGSRNIAKFSMLGHMIFQKQETHDENQIA
jgi:hypothetical protein